jgi:O-antigen/teichoic acid export membrane protein
MIIVLIAGPELIAFVLGGDWVTAGTYAQWLAVWLLFLFVSSPLTRLFDVLERLRASLAFNVLLFGVRSVVLVIGGMIGDPLVAVALYGAASALLYAGLLVWLLVLAEVRLRESVRFMCSRLAISAVPAVAVAATVSRFSPVVTFAVALLAALAYGGVLVALHRRRRGLS